MHRDLAIDFLKGIAIIAVVFLHIIPFYLNVTPIDSKFGLQLITLDQLFRYAVPIFVLCSGYMLGAKYREQKFGVSEIKKFFVSRIVKLLPLYFLWVGVTYLVTHLVPGWSGFGDSFPLREQIFLGRVDYQMYFLPMIISLYLIFPIIYLLIKKIGILILFITLFVQLWFYWYLGNIVVHDLTVKNFQTDQQQYIFFLSWIFYFVLGIYLGNRKIVKNWILFFIFSTLSVIGFKYLLDNSLFLLEAGHNVISALRFTREIVIVYSLSLFLAIIYFPGIENSPGKKIVNAISFLGKNSFLIFLSHTLILRIIYTPTNIYLTILSLTIIFLGFLVSRKI